jgi:inosose dehydratase
MHLLKDRTMSVSTRIHVGVSPLSWTNDVLEDLGGDIPLETCLAEAAEAGYEELNLAENFHEPSTH